MLEQGVQEDMLVLGKSCAFQKRLGVWFPAKTVNFVSLPYLTAKPLW